MSMQPAHKPTVTETAPVDWTATQEILAKDALAVLTRHYFGVRWGVEFTQTLNGEIGSMVIRMLDMPSRVVYVVNQKDIDRDRMRCVIKAGGELLEAHGLSRDRFRKDRGFRGLKQTRSGLIVPDYAAVPEQNPGYETIKKDFEKLHGK